jgi:thiamine biosynthesis lipoprotein
MPEGIMGTSCQISVVMDFRDQDKAERILDSAEARIRYIESLASNWIENSEISEFNRMEPGSYDFNAHNLAIFEAGKAAFESTQGAFDMTCRPMIELWKQAGKAGHLPDDQAIVAARALSNWDQIEFTEEETIKKEQATTRVDLGGIAKGYAIDLALEIMQSLGAQGGLVDIGGDIRFFGVPASENGAWKVAIRHPRKDEPLAHLNLLEGASVCTSGNYVRYVTIDGVKYSHILDPRTGLPTKDVPSVTVVAPIAMEADIWATALSVLGKDGLEILPEGIEAMLVMGESESAFEIFSSPGFEQLIAD